MIDLYHVHKVYPGQIVALDDVTFHVEKGEFVFLTGPSGAGKTTVLKLILCAERPTRGQILVNMQNISRIKGSKIPLFRRQIGFVFQDFKLIETMSVYENIAFALRVTGARKSEIMKKVNLQLRMLGLENRSTSSPQRLSGGERQRVAIARAIVNNPMILLADEPTGNLDPEIAMDIMDIFMTINRKGTTVIVATHNTDLVKKFNQRIISLDKGRIVSR
jgi:cell division transport system ATP-binding protein